MSPSDRLKVLLFFALFFGAVGFLSTLLSCGTEYWLLAAESCSRADHQGGGGAEDVRIFHEGLFWRCSYSARSQELSIWDLWSSQQPPVKVCQSAFLFPFPAHDQLGSPSLPAAAYERHAAIVFRTFWSIFLVAGVAAVVVGGFIVICAGPLGNHKLYKVGGALQLFGGLGLLAVLLMYLMWVQVLDTLEQFVLHQRVSRCPSFHLTVQHGPSFLLAPVAIFFWLLAGLLFLLVGQSTRILRLEKRRETPEAYTVLL
ncbi:transmembrane protein 182-like [Aulostomus maculatus]